MHDNHLNAARILPSLPRTTIVPSARARPLARSKPDTDTSSESESDSDDDNNLTSLVQRQAEIEAHTSAAQRSGTQSASNRFRPSLGVQPGGRPPFTAHSAARNKQLGGQVERVRLPPNARFGPHATTQSSTDQRIHRAGSPVSRAASREPALTVAYRSRQSLPPRPSAPARFEIQIVPGRLFVPIKRLAEEDGEQSRAHKKVKIELSETFQSDIGAADPAREGTSGGVREDTPPPPRLPKPVGPSLVPTVPVKTETRRGDPIDDVGRVYPRIVDPREPFSGATAHTWREDPPHIHIQATARRHNVIARLQPSDSFRPEEKRYENDFCSSLRCITPPDASPRQPLRLNLGQPCSMRTGLDRCAALVLARAYMTPSSFVITADLVVDKTRQAVEGGSLSDGDALLQAVTLNRIILFLMAYTSPDVAERYVILLPLQLLCFPD